MDITTLAAWGEFLGGIAVVVSLVYLAGQIRINTKTVRASNYSDLLATTRNLSQNLLAPEMASLYLQGLSDFEGLSSEDQLRFNSLMVEVVHANQRAWHFHREALLDSQMFEAQTHALTHHLATAGGRQWWAANRHWYPGDFLEFVDGLIREGEAAG
jgi:hypothetical protein